MSKGRPSPRKLILRSAYAVGDIVVLTAALRDLHLTYPKRFITDVRTSCAELWEHNPYITPLKEGEKGVEVIDCEPDLIRDCNRTPYHYIQAYSEFLNARLDLKIKPSAFHGDVHLSDQEKSWFSQVHELTGQDTPFWIIVAGGKNDITIKWWSSERYQELVDHFRGKVLFVQVGELQDHHPALKGVIDLRGKTDLRQLVRLVYHAQGVVCGVTGLMHLAAAVERKDTGQHDRPCVVIAGGREPPQWESYPAHQFIHNVGMIPCSAGGCWRSRVKPLGDGNERDEPNQICQDVVGDLPRCMDLISAEDVIQRIEGYFRGGAANYLTSEQAQAAGRGVKGRPLSGNLRRPVLVGPTESSWKKNGKPDPDGLTLVTLNDDVMAAVAGVTGPRLREYANRHHYALLHYEKLLDPSRHASWNKILAVRNALLTRQSEWVMWMDADAMVMDLDFPATRLIDDKVDLIFGSDYNGMNAGIFLIRYCDWSLRFLESSYFLGECYADPDGYNPLWEQSTFKHLIVHFPEVERRVKILPQAAMNSDGGTYQEGDFILHLAGVPNEKRLETFAKFGFNIREGAGALEAS